MLLLSTAGCGGFSGSKSVSPGSFFMPGLMQTAPPPARIGIPESPATNPPAPVDNQAE